MNLVKMTMKSRTVRIMFAILWLISSNVYVVPVLHAEDPTIKEVKRGNVEVSRENNRTRIKASDDSIINYDKFDISSNHTVEFDQPSSNARVLNRVVSGNHSDIHGDLLANGHVYLMNRAGITIGSSANINVGGLVAGTGGLSNQEFLNEIHNFTDIQGDLINRGEIRAENAVHLLGERVKNVGSIVAENGQVTMASGKEITLADPTGENHVMVSIEKNVKDREEATVQNEGELNAKDGTVNLSAGDAAGVAIHHEGTTSGTNVEVDAGDQGDVNVDGTMKASGDSNSGGNLEITSGNGNITGTGTLDATGLTGGRISLDGGQVVLSSGSLVDASGRQEGGTILMESTALDLDGTIRAKGREGSGGSIRLSSNGYYNATSSQVVNVSGTTGGDIQLDTDGRIITSGEYLAKGTDGSGGRIEMSSQTSLGLLSARLNASGTEGGGDLLLGGHLTLGEGHEPLPSSPYTLVSAGTELNASATGSNGEGGSVRVWSDHLTKFYGEIDARPGTETGSGGFVEISSEGRLGKFETDAIQAGRENRTGTILLDPKNIVITETTSNLALEAVLRNGSSITNNSGNGNERFELNPENYFGSGLALNGEGSLLAVGAAGEREQEGFQGEEDGGRGAVYLFHIDTELSGTPKLEQVIRDGRSVTNNSMYESDVVREGQFELDSGDEFGTSVALNDSGNVLAVGAPGDRSKQTSGEEEPETVFGFEENTGAAYLFQLEPEFNEAPLLKQVIRDGRPIQKTTEKPAVLDEAETLDLDRFDRFGASVALNGSGNRLAVGAPGDDGEHEFIFGGAGAAYLFQTQTGWSKDPSLEHIIRNKGPGRVKPGLQRVRKESRDFERNFGDRFGTSVALNGAGDLLAVGSFGIREAYRERKQGAVFLFHMNEPFDRTPEPDQVIRDGRMISNNTEGDLYENERVELRLDRYDIFGSAVSLNGPGDRLAVGAPGDRAEGGEDGERSGATYLFQIDPELTRDPSLEQVIREDRSIKDNTSAEPEDEFVDERKDFELDRGDWFGTSVALDRTGTLLAVGAIGDDGERNRVDNSGAVYLYRGRSQGSLKESFSYNDSGTTYLNSEQITGLLDSGNQVELLANNDITVSSDLRASAEGKGGDLIMKAGRSIRFDSDVTVQTDNGNFTAIANAGDRSVVEEERDVGDATLIMDSGASVEAGTGVMNLSLQDGDPDAGRNEFSAGNMTLRTLQADTLKVSYRDSTSGEVNQRSGSIVAKNVLLSGNASFDLTRPGNEVSTLAADLRKPGDSLAYSGTDGVSVGTINATNGIKTNDGTVRITVNGTLDVAEKLNAGTAGMKLGVDEGVITDGDSANGSITAASLLIRSFDGSDVVLNNNDAHDVDALAVKAEGETNTTGTFEYRDMNGLRVDAITFNGTTVEGIQAGGQEVRLTTGEFLEVNDQMVGESGALVAGTDLILDSGLSEGDLSYGNTDGIRQELTLAATEGNFRNNAGSDVIRSAESSDRWLVYSGGEDATEPGGLSPNFEEFDREWPQEPDHSGDGVMYREVQEQNVVNVETLTANVQTNEQGLENITEQEGQEREQEGEQGGTEGIEGLEEEIEEEQEEKQSQGESEEDEKKKQE